MPTRGNVTGSLLSKVLAEVKAELADDLSKGHRGAQKRCRDEGNGLSSEEDDETQHSIERGRDKTGKHVSRQQPKTRREVDETDAKALIKAILERVGPLSSLKAKDWDVVLHPIAQLRPYLDSTARAAKGASPHRHGDGDAAGADVDTIGSGPSPPPTLQERQQPHASLVDYVKCRAAELPMRLQIEAMQMRRHEQSVRTHTKELVQLSEFLTYVDRHHPAEFDAAPGGSGGASPGPLELLVAPMEVQRRVSRVKERVSELESLIRAQTEGKVQCAERMVLLSAMTALLLERVAGATEEEA